MDDTVCDATIGHNAARLARRELSAVELAEATCARIARLEPRLAAHAAHRAEAVLAQAAAADRRLAAGEGGPLCGIPIGLKDIIAAADWPTGVGSVVLDGWRPGGDATVAARLRAAGAVITGKHRTTEAACGAHHPALPAPLNPWRAEAWTGVSSSGSGVAVAAGLAGGAFGSDTGGSIRFPAHCCGVVGLKPSWGRVSRHGVFPLAESLDHVGPFARSVVDCALLYAAVAGHDADDPSTLDDAVEPWSATTADVRSLRIGLDEALLAEDLAPPVAAMLAHAVAILREAGAMLVTVQVPRLGEAVTDWLNLCAAEAVTAHAATFPARRDDYGPALRALLDYGRGLDAATLAHAAAARADFRVRHAAIFEDVDLYLSPTFDRPTPSAEEAARLMRGDGLRRFVAFTAPANLCGNPTLSLPAALDADGVPLGFQLVGRHGAEAALFTAGLACERGLGWTARPRLP
ncbi:MAG: amidase [Gammaproteobacteria bacterium]|nr:amidase [Gammaproteobacteria bacterium]MCP5200364.1 amidase [Gammaproteobacteria bacterium]